MHLLNPNLIPILAHHCHLIYSNTSVKLHSSSSPHRMLPALNLSKLKRITLLDQTQGLQYAISTEAHQMPIGSSQVDHEYNSSLPLLFPKGKYLESCCF